MKAALSPTTGNLPASASHSAARSQASVSTTVLGSRGSLRRATTRRAPASCAPFRTSINCDGRLRREPDAQQFLPFTKAKTRWQ